MVSVAGLEPAIISPYTEMVCRQGFEPWNPREWIYSPLALATCISTHNIQI